jgi:hypothetical protein
MDPVNSRRMILKTHHTIERDLSASRMEKRTGLARLEGVMAVEMPPQRIFTAKVSQSIVQRQGG